MKFKISSWIALLCLVAAPAVLAQPCPEKNVQYWQAFPPGGESDLSARHQQLVLKKKCSAIDTIIQYKAGAGGGLMWSQMNSLPGDGLNVVGINLPHIVFQPIEGEVQYKTADITPVFWFHYTPDVLVVPEASPYKTFAEFIAAAKKSPGKMNLGGSGLNSANHAAHERLNAAFGIKSTYVPYKGTGDMSMAVVGAQIDGAMTYTPICNWQQGQGSDTCCCDGKTPSTDARCADLQRAWRGLDRRRLPRYRRAKSHLTGCKKATVRPLGGAEQRTGDERPGGQKWF